MQANGEHGTNDERLNYRYLGPLVMETSARMGVGMGTDGCVRVRACVLGAGKESRIYPPESSCLMLSA